MTVLGQKFPQLFSFVSLRIKKTVAADITPARPLFATTNLTPPAFCFADCRQGESIVDIQVNYSRNMALEERLSAENIREIHDAHTHN
jgi:hypothetical protein